jgi:hypothetical protein
MWSHILTSRNVAVAKYICFFVAGVLFIIEPLTSVKREANTANIILWHGFMITGAVIGFVGALSKKYLIEGLALPLLGAALVAYVAILLYSATTVTVGLGLLITTAILGLLGRAIAIWELSKIERDIQGRG